MALSLAFAPGAITGTGLHERALLIDHTVRKGWSARRHDARVDREVKQQHGSDGSYSRQLADRKAWPQLDALLTILDAAGQEHRRRTLPWSENGGPRILAADGYFDYCAAQRTFEDRLPGAIDELVVVWPDIIQAKADTDDLFRSGDFPAAHELRGLFAIGYNVMPLPAANDFRVDLGSIETERIRRSIESNVQDALNLGMQDVYGRVKDLLEHMIERLKAYQANLDDPVSVNKRAGNFHGTLVTNVSDLLAILPSLNITGDQLLADVGARMQAELTRYSAEQLKDSQNKRHETLAAAEDILAAMHKGGFA